MSVTEVLADIGLEALPKLTLRCPTNGFNVNLDDMTDLTKTRDEHIERLSPDSQCESGSNHLKGDTSPNLDIEVQPEIPVVAGIPTWVYVKVKVNNNGVIYLDAAVLVKTLKFQVIDEASGEFLKHTVQTKDNGHRNELKLYFRPLTRGRCIIKVRVFANGLLPVTLNASTSVEVAGNSHVLAFSDGDDMPVAVSYRPGEQYIYVGYDHHVSRFSQEGDFLKEILRLSYAHINDLAVDRIRYRLAIGVSGWSKDSENKVRFQEVRLHSMTGLHLWTVKEPDLFQVPIMHFAFTSAGHVIIVAKDVLCLVNKGNGLIEKKSGPMEYQMASRIVVGPSDEIVIADAANGCIHILDRYMHPKQKFSIQGDSGDNLTGLTGLAIDKLGNVLVSDCVTGQIFLHQPDGVLYSAVESEWDPPRWPLALAVSEDGHVFVADHGNACIKKYRYM